MGYIFHCGDEDHSSSPPPSKKAKSIGENKQGFNPTSITILKALGYRPR